MTEAGLARFLDRFTIEYVRTYAHPVDRVWRAVTDPAEFGQWFIPGELEPRVGGAYRFRSYDDGFKGVVLAIEPPRRVRFQGPTGETGWFEYELTDVDGGTRMRFVQHFPTDGDYAETPGALGGDLPGGSGTPWKPAFVGGWHEFWEALGDYLDGVPLGSRLPPSEFGAIAAAWAQTSAPSLGLTDDLAQRIVRDLRRQERWNDLNKVYSRHIRETLPAG
jgi:uncharacterized protein YndB with AHSA1/START domain